MKVQEFRYEDLHYWANYVPTAKKKETSREISIENLERWSKNWKYKNKNEDLKCKVCDYNGKKNTTMEKHMNTKHVDDKGSKKT